MLLWHIVAGLFCVIATPRVQCSAVNDVTVVEDEYGILGNQTVKRYTFSNSKMTVQIITYGGRISAIKVPDAHGGTQDVVLGFDNLKGLFCVIATPRVQCSAVNDVTVVEDEYGILGNQTVKRYTFSNSKMTVQIITYGGRISAIKVPDAHGGTQDVVLGFDNLKGFLQKNDPYFGAIIGRVANRIGSAKFTLYGAQYNVTPNEGQNQLHGGLRGFDKVVWEPFLHKKKLTMSYASVDGEEGFPGTVITHVTYELTPDNELIFSVKAATTKPTPINIANHAYFNLAGHASGPNGLFQHVVSINADLYTATDNQSIPTGELVTVAGTDLDFRTPHLIGPLIQQRGGYDSNYCVNTDGHVGLVFVSRVVHPESGRYLEIYSDQPGVQFYTGNGLPQQRSVDPIIGKGGVKYHQYGSFSLETQNYPDAVNHRNFPSSILNPGTIYSHTTIYKFGTTAEERMRCNNSKYH